MQAKYHICKEGKNIGSFTLDAIFNMLKSNEIGPLDYIYIDEKNDWVGLMEFEPVMQFLKEKKPKVTPKVDSKPKDNEASTINDVEDAAWFVLRGEEKFGPYNYVDLIKMLQEKNLFEYDFVWNKSLLKWTRIAELRDFAPEKIRTLLNVYKDSFFRRKYNRSSMGGTLILHDNYKVWKGEGIEISEGGCGIKVFNSMLQPGDKVFIHFKPNSILPPFNALCEIVSKKFDPGTKNIEHPICYGVRFLELDLKAKKTIKDFTSKAA